MTLEEFFASAFEDMKPGDVTPITENWCRHCESTDLYMECRLRPTEPQGSLAGTSPKVTAWHIYVLCCATCGRFSGDRGES